MRVGAGADGVTEEEMRAGAGADTKLENMSSSSIFWELVEEVMSPPRRSTELLEATTELVTLLLVEVVFCVRATEALLELFILPELVEVIKLTCCLADVGVVLDGDRFI